MKQSLLSLVGAAALLLAAVPAASAQADPVPVIQQLIAAVARTPPRSWRHSPTTQLLLADRAAMSRAASASAKRS
ncbi:MAG: hypothetical protein ACR2IK_00015 [Chloroflexota bacterium]